MSKYLTNVPRSDYRLNEPEEPQGYGEVTFSEPEEEDEIYEAAPQPRPQSYVNTGFAPGRADKLMRKAVYVVNAAEQGLSLGWSDEIAGVSNALGYALGSLNPKWNKRHESLWEAAKRGYIEGRDHSRQVLEEGREREPVLTGISEGVGAMATPANWIFPVNRAAPLAKRIALSSRNSTIGGAVAGWGTSQGNWQKQLGGAAFGAGLGYVSRFAGRTAGKNFIITPTLYGPNLVPGFVEFIVNRGVPTLFNSYISPQEDDNS